MSLVTCICLTEYLFLESSSLYEQLNKFSVFDLRGMISEPPPPLAPVKWHQFFQSPWATSLEVRHMQI